MKDSLNKSEITEQLAERMDLSQRQSQAIIDELLSIITESLTEDGQKVTLHGFGTFDISERKARQGVDPRDHQKKITIPAHTVPRFRPGSKLKRAVKEAFDS
ncbi:MAG: HU family DNA-binding protein [bacterium]